MQISLFGIVSCVLCLGEARPRLKVSDPFLPPKDALPYAHRGIKLGQIEEFVNSYAIGAGSVTLRKVCDKFNHENKERVNLTIDDPDHVYRCNSENPQAYDMVDHLIIPLTNPQRRAAHDAPEGALSDVPMPSRNISMAELLNPDGFPDGVDVFMTWSWEADIAGLVRSLRQHAETVYLDVGKSRPEDVVFWICAFVLNQHQVGDELNWDLSMAPFRLGLGYAKHAIMLLNEDKYGRVLTAWNYYEILVCHILSKRLMPIGDGLWSGGARESASGIWGNPTADKKAKYLNEFNISHGVPDYRTGATDADMQMIMELIGTTQLGVDGLTNRIKSMIATGLSYYALQKMVDASTLIHHKAILTNMQPSWKSTGDRFALVPDFMGLLESPEYTPVCMAAVPLGVEMNLLTGEAVHRNQQLLHQAEVTLKCADDDSVFVSTCQCYPASPDDVKSACLWSTPRPRGKQSCWPEHEAGELDCHDHTPLPPVIPEFCGDRCSGHDLKDLVCTSAAAAITV